MFDKQLNFTFTTDSQGQVFIEAEDYASEYTTWQNIEDGEDIENAVSIACDEDIKSDLEVSYDVDVLYVELYNFDYDENEKAGSFTLTVTFDAEEDPMEDDEDTSFDESFNVRKLNIQLSRMLKERFEDEPIDDEYENIRDVLNAYADSENAFIDGYVTIDELKQFDADHWLENWSDEAIIDCALEMGYTVEDKKILDPMKESLKEELTTIPGFRGTNIEINEDDFTDALDVSFDVSLYEYGVVRNPKNNQTILSTRVDDNGRCTDFVIEDLSVSDVKHVLQNIEEGFFSFIGETREEALNNLHNDNLSIYIFDINTYNGYFIPAEAYSPHFTNEDLNKDRQEQQVYYESLNEDVLYDIYNDGELTDGKGRNAEYIIAYVNDLIDTYNSYSDSTHDMDYVDTLQQARRVAQTMLITFPLHRMNESLNEETTYFEAPRYTVISMNLKRNSQEGIGIIWELDFDDPREAVKFLKKKQKEEPQHLIEVIDTITDKVIYSTDKHSVKEFMKNIVY